MMIKSPDCQHGKPMNNSTKKSHLQSHTWYWINNCWRKYLVTTQVDWWSYNFCVKKIKVHTQLLSFYGTSQITEQNTVQHLQKHYLKNSYLRCDCISISLFNWCSTFAFWIWDLNRTFKATINLELFSLARYTLPNFPFPRARPISKSARVHFFL